MQPCLTMGPSRRGVGQAEAGSPTTFDLQTEDKILPTVLIVLLVLFVLGAGGRLPTWLPYGKELP